MVKKQTGIRALGDVLPLVMHDCMSHVYAPPPDRRSLHGCCPDCRHFWGLAWH